jgi:prepilin signal peptidase PulO-like enzyme (type II secretory pathway)
VNFFAKDRVLEARGYGLIFLFAMLSCVAFAVEYFLPMQIEALTFVLIALVALLYVALDASQPDPTV